MFLAKRFLYPPKPILFTLPPLVFAALIYIFISGEKNGIPAYCIYCMSAYCLTVLVLPFPKFFKRAKTAVTKKISETKFGSRYTTDLAFRGNVAIHQGLAINLLYAIFRIAVGIVHSSVWFISMAVYYSVLAVLRLYLIISYRRRNAESEIKCYKNAARMLFLLNIPMGGMITLMILKNFAYSYPGYVIYLSAMYTFYAVIMSVVNIVRYRKVGSPVLSAAKALNFISASMSLLGLQTAMISQFSAEGKVFGRMMNSITGSVVWLSVIAIAVYMLFHSIKLKQRGEDFEPFGK